jgi:hypothetical protein
MFHKASRRCSSLQRNVSSKLRSNATPSLCACSRYTKGWTDRSAARARWSYSRPLLLKKASKSLGFRRSGTLIPSPARRSAFRLGCAWQPRRRGSPAPHGGCAARRRPLPELALRTSGGRPGDLASPSAQASASTAQRPDTRRPGGEASRCARSRDWPSPTTTTLDPSRFGHSSRAQSHPRTLQPSARLTTQTVSSWPGSRSFSRPFHSDLCRATGYEQPDGIPDLNCRDQTRRDVLDGWEATRMGRRSCWSGSALVRVHRDEVAFR